jgi:hypothetical protein
MNCCNNGGKVKLKKSKRPHKHMSHMWMMVLCCGAPLILLLVISLLGASFSGLKLGLVGILPFICPVMMIAMIPMMLRRGKDTGGHNEINTTEIDSLKNETDSNLLLK